MINQQDRRRKPVLIFQKKCKRLYFELLNLQRKDTKWAQNKVETLINILNKYILGRKTYSLSILNGK